MIHSVIIVWYRNYEKLSVFLQSPFLELFLRTGPYGFAKEHLGIALGRVCMGLVKSDSSAALRDAGHQQSIACTAKYTLISTTDWGMDRKKKLLKVTSIFSVLPLQLPLPTSTAGKDLIYLLKHSYQSRANISHSPPTCHQDNKTQIHVVIS